MGHSFCKRNRGVDGDWHGSNAVLGASVYQSVGISQVNERIALSIYHPHHAKLLKEDGQTLVEDLLLPRNGLYKRDWPHLPACDGSLGKVLCQTDGPLEATGLRS